MVRVRGATLDDLDVLVGLARAFYDEDGFATATGELRHNLEVLLRADNAHLVVATNGSRGGPVHGFALTTTAFVLESGLVAELQDLYVVPAQRGNGTGSALIEDAARWARVRSATLLEVVLAPNGRDVTHLLGYYRSRGFLDEGRRIVARTLSGTTGG
ncbi:MAG: N-acetyltransferase [Jatrophihabitans sp.]|nr:MAG: N-acetyltransferase [Jatrophihabitans sp.]